MSQDEATLPLKAALGTDRRARRRSLSERLVHLAASRIARGTLTIIAEGRVTRFGVPEEGGLAAEIRVRDRRFFAEVATGGVVAVGDTYRDGLWETPDLVALIRLLVRNRDALASVDGRLARLVPAAPAGASRPTEHRLGEPSEHRGALRPVERVLRAPPR
jgi:cyclopropane-fatty-acyl-phospholipid synthase